MFCQLEDDQKTFEYIRHYIQQWREHRSLGNTDNRLTAQEIEWHITHLPSHPENGERREEMLRWIHQNGKAFRAYLNTIKLVFVVYYCSGNDWKDITWDQFRDIRNKLNHIKDPVLDTIFIENTKPSMLQGCFD